jgi:hypothetical protein
MYGMNVGPSPASFTPSISSTLLLIVGDGICVTLATPRTPGIAASRSWSCWKKTPRASGVG